MKLKKFIAVLAVVAAVCASLPARAQPSPDKPVKLVVGYPAGGGVDYVARILAQQLGELWHQTVTVENRSGASGAIAADFVARSRPDGTTFLLASPAEVLVGPIAGQKTPYDPARSLVPVVLAGETALGIAAFPSVPAANLKELIAISKAQKLSYGTPGSGSTMHFAGEALNEALGMSMVHVPYRGAAPAVKICSAGRFRSLSSVCRRW